MGDSCGLYPLIRGCLAAAAKVCWPDAVVSRADLSLEFFKRTKPGDDSAKDRAGIS